MTNINWASFKFDPKKAAENLKSQGNNNNEVVVKKEFPDPPAASSVYNNTRFDSFRPKWHTPCPNCSINPQNFDYVRKHLISFHRVENERELEELINSIDTTAVDYPPHPVQTASSLPPSSPERTKKRTVSNQPKDNFKDFSGQISTLAKQSFDDEDENELKIMENMFSAKEPKENELKGEMQLVGDRNNLKQSSSLGHSNGRYEPERPYHYYARERQRTYPPASYRSRGGTSTSRDESRSRNRREKSRSRSRSRDPRRTLKLNFKTIPFF
jgi:hypothetical protein